MRVRTSAGSAARLRAAEAAWEPSADSGGPEEGTRCLLYVLSGIGARESRTGE